MDMKIEPIKIDIEPLKIFAQLALILDQDELMEGIYKIRKRWQLEANLIPYKDFEEWYKNNWGDLPLTEDAYYYLSTAKDQLEIRTGQSSLDPITEYQRNKELAYLNSNDFELNHLLRKNGIKNPTFQALILKAIICGEVNQEDWDKLENGDGATLYGEWLFDDTEFFAGLEKIYKADTKPEIKRDRKWYWLKRSGKTYREIAEGDLLAGKINMETLKKNVKKQIKRYKEFLRGKRGDI